MRTYPTFMRHFYEDRIEHFVFIGAYDSEDKAIARIQTEARGKMQYLKKIYPKGEARIKLINGNSCSPQVLFGQDEVYEYFYVDCSVNSTPYINITE